MTLGSLFDGAGTACLAAKLIGITPVWSSEIEKFPLKVTKLRFPEVQQLGDITKINGAEIPPVDIIVFGSPCQNYAEKIQFKPESVSGDFETMRQSFRDYKSDLAKSFGVTGRRPYDNGNNDDGRSGDTLKGQQNKNSGESFTNPVRGNGTRGGTFLV